MLVLIDCACGARFETDARPGRTVVCPDCSERLTVPAPANTPPRTSGLALASAVVGLVGLFTVVLTILAAFLGLAALVSIRRHRAQLAGSGYAIFGIVLGVVFTPLSMFAYSRTELLEGMREQFITADVDRSGPLEVLRPEDGFAITRPSTRWGLARGDLAQEIRMHESSLLLADPGKEAYLEASLHAVERTQTLDQCRDEVVSWFRPRGFGSRDQSITHYMPRRSQRLPNQHGLEVEELLFEFRILNQRVTNLVRILRRKDDDRMYVLRGWAAGRRFPHVESQIRKAQESFRLLAP